MPKISKTKEEKAKVKAPPNTEECEEISLEDMTTIDDGTSKLESQIKGGDINAELDDPEDEVLND